MKNEKVIGAIALGALALGALKLISKSSSKKREKAPAAAMMPRTTASATPAKTYFCKFCGREFNSIRDLRFGSNCPNHPQGYCKGKHEVYEGR